MRIIRKVVTIFLKMLIPLAIAWAFILVENKPWDVCYALYNDQTMDDFVSCLESPVWLWKREP